FSLRPARLVLRCQRIQVYARGGPSRTGSIRRNPGSFRGKPAAEKPWTEKLRDKSSRGNASQFFIAGELCRPGYSAVVTLGNTPNVDILCSNQKGTRFAHIQVKQNLQRRNASNEERRPYVLLGFRRHSTGRVRFSSSRPKIR